MNCLLVMKIKWSLDINTGAVERSEASRVRRLAGATGGNNTLRAGAPALEEAMSCDTGSMNWHNTQLRPPM